MDPAQQDKIAAAQSAAASYTAPTPVAQSTDPLYTATWLNTEPHQSLFQAPRKVLAEQTTPNQAEAARKLSGSFSEAAGKPPLPPLSPRVINMMEQSTEIVMQMSEWRNRGDTLENEKWEMQCQRDEAVNKLVRLQELMRSLESFATDTVNENKTQKEKIAERESHIIVMSTAGRGRTVGSCF